MLAQSREGEASAARLALPCLFVIAVLLPHPAAAYSYFEHKWLGDAACGAVNDPAKLPCDLHLSDRPVPPEEALTFGDLVALAGDHFKDPEHLAAAIGEYAEVLDEWLRAGCQDETLTKRQWQEAGCDEKQGRLNDDPLYQVLQARNLQLVGVRRWMSGAGRADAPDVQACLFATPWLAPVDVPNGDPAASPAPPPPPPPPPPFPAAPAPAPAPSAEPPPAPLAPALACRRALLDELHRLQALARKDRWPTPEKGDCYEPTDTEENEFSLLPGYAALANANGNHFGQRSEAEWRRLHGKAQSYRPPRRSRLALAAEAFALHFLTDRFAAGHIRTRRDVVSNTEALRRHDYDNMYGLIVEANEDGGWARWESLGDKCLLGEGGRSSRAMATLAALDSLDEFAGTTAAPPGLIGFPAVYEARNRPVPRDPSTLGITLQPAVSFVTGRDDHGALYGLGLSARTYYRFNLGAPWAPPNLTQFILQTTTAHTVFVPISVNAWQFLCMLLGLVSSHNAEVSHAIVHIRDFFGDTVYPFGPVRVSLEPYFGWAIIRSGDTGQVTHAMHAGLELRWRLFSRWSLALGGSAFLPQSPQLINVSLGLGADL